MRKWGLVVTLFYAVIVIVLLMPGFAWLAGAELKNALDLYRHYQAWIAIAITVSGQGLLLFLSVDTSHKRLPRRAHVLVSCSLTAVFLAILTFAAILSLVYGILGDKGETVLNPARPEGWPRILGVWACLCLFWGIVFYRYARDSSSVITQAVSWLLKGSVLELLVAVPCHIVVRYRKICSAPIMTSFGITTGLAVMLLSFGPGVLFLYKMRLAAHKPRALGTDVGHHN